MVQSKYKKLIKNQLLCFDVSSWRIDSPEGPSVYSSKSEISKITVPTIKQ